MLPMSNYPDGFNTGVLIRELLVNTPPRKQLWVGNNGTTVKGEITASDNANYGTFLKPFSTVDYAIGQSKAGDVIFVRPDADQTVSAAGGIACDVAGITICFLGTGTSRANTTFTATASDIDITAADVTIINPRFVTGIDAVAAAIHVAAADFKLIGAEFYDAAAKATTVQILTTSAASRMLIDGYRFVASTTGTQKTSGIQIVGGDGIVLRNVDIRADFSTSPVNVSTAATNVLLENLYLNNTNSGPQPALTLAANTTGFGKNVKCRVASGTSYVSSVAKLSWGADCEGFSTDGYGGDPIGTQLAAGIEGKLDVIDGYFDVPTADATTDTTMRDVIGKKNDAAVNAVTTTKSVMAYTKGIVNEITVPSADSTDNGFTNDVVGNKTDAAVGAVTTTKSLMAYLKGVLNAVTTGALSVQERVAVSATAVMVNGDTIFTVAGGPIEIEGLWSECVTANDGTASTLQYSVTHATLGDVTISGASGSLASVAAGSHVTLQTTALSTAALLATEGATIHATGPSKILMQPGAIKVVIGVGSTTGTWKHYLRYKPMAVGVTVV